VQRYIVKRLAASMVTLFLVSVIIFASVRAAPGDVVSIKLAEAGYSPERAEALREQLGLDQPLLVQYADWAGSLLTGDFGKSLFSDKSIGTSIRERLPVTIELAVGAATLGAALGIFVGVTAAVWQDRPVDYIARSISIAAISIPSFVFALAVIVVPARLWGWTIPLKYVGPSDFGNHIVFMIAPVIVLGTLLSGSTQRMTRATMLEVLGSDYIRTARAKGLAQRQIILVHAFKNAAIPVATIIGGQMAFLFGGAIIIETIFGIPGMGRLTTDALSYRDYPVMQGTAMTFAVAILVINLVVDLSYGFLDPRIRYS
jgi:peptide/nickel transport system permease protein